MAQHCVTHMSYNCKISDISRTPTTPVAQAFNSAGNIKNPFPIFAGFYREIGNIANIYVIWLPILLALDCTFLALKTPFKRCRRLHKVVKGYPEWLNWKIFGKSNLVLRRFYNSAGQNRIGIFELLCHWGNVVTRVTFHAYVPMLNVLLAPIV